MKKFLLSAIILVLILSALFFSTPIRTIGTGVLLDNNGRLLVLTSLVNNASKIIVKFPNADNIEAVKTKIMVSKLLSILQLKTPPKVERSSIRFSSFYEIKNGDYIFALLYPIANTQEDKHILREGNIISAKGPDRDERFFEIDFPIKPGEGGTALFNGRGEVVGIALSPGDIQKILNLDLKTSNAKGYGLKISFMKKAKDIFSPKSQSSSSLHKNQRNLSKELPHFIEGIQKNIILVETEN